MVSLALPVIDRKTTGIIVYEGASELDGEPIVAIMTGFKGSDNTKTGNMLQVTIMRADMNPLEALELGDDKSVCGTCFHRDSRSCYVNVATGPYQTYKSYAAGKYPMADASCLDYIRGRVVRLGAYGDPAAVPTTIWRSIAGVAKSVLGYTHNWKDCDPELKNYCMASCDLESEADEARSMGWRPFRIMFSDEGTIVNDLGRKTYFSCPASAESGKKMTCKDCQACSGGEYNGRPTPVIQLHGPSWKKAYAKRGMEARLAGKSVAMANFIPKF